MNSLKTCVWGSAVALAVVLSAVACNESLAQKDVDPPPIRPERKPLKEAAIDFEKYDTGKTPADFTAALTGGEDSLVRPSILAARSVGSGLPVSTARF